MNHQEYLSSSPFLSSLLTRAKYHPSAAKPYTVKTVALCVAAILGTPMALAHPDLTAHIESFEGTDMPTGISGQGLALSTEHAIMGEQALNWTWSKADASITLRRHFPRLSDQDANAAKGVYSGYTQVLSFWIYNDTAVNADLRVKLGTSSTFTDEFPVNLNFTGWRAIGVSLNHDFNLNGTGSHAATTDFQQLRFQAPKGMTSGKVIIDRIMVSVDDNRYQWSDDQVTTRYSEPSRVQVELPSPLPPPSVEALQAAADIRQALTEDVATSNQTLSELRRRLDAFILRHAGSEPILRHVITDKQQVIYQPAYLDTADKADFDQYALLGDSDSDGNKVTGYGRLMLDIASSWFHTDNAATRSELADMYLLMSRHLLNQGYADGSALVTTHHWGYSSREWYLSALIMADELSKAGIRQEIYNALLWFSREFNESFNMALIPESANMDYFNTLARPHLAMLLLTPDEKKRIALLNRYSDFLSEAITQVPPGDHDGFRPDGTTWRHKGHYPGYSFPAMSGLANVIFHLRQSPFSVSTEALDVVKKAMLTGWIHSNPVVPLGLAGRHPFTTLSVQSYAEGMREIALSYPVLDTELASVYLQVKGKTAAESTAIFGQRIKPANLQEGNWSFNGGAFNIHRSGDRMAVIKGYNKDVWSSEIYTHDNRYGRYQSHGSVHVMPYGNPANWGHTQSGWDWSRNPGTTTLYLPVNELESPKQSTVMVRSIEGSSGSTSLLNRYGLFSFNHVEHAEGGLTGFDDTFRARKYVMASGDELYLVGNSITSSSPNTETTLFQISQRTGASLNINGKTVTATHYTGTLQKGQWIIDDNGVGYYLADGPTLQIRRGTQESRHNKTKAVTRGNFSTAWLPHGDNPVNQAYEYVIVMNATPAKMAAVKAKMDTGEHFRTLQSNTNKQVLFAAKDNLYGYTTYGDKGVSYAQGPLRFVNNTAITLVKEHQKRLEVSISSPELYLNDTTAATPADYRLEFAGEWALAAPSEAITLSAAGGKTIIDTSSTFGMASTFTLCKPKTDCKADQPTEPEPNPTPDPEIGPSTGDSGGGGGSLGLLTLTALTILGRLRKTHR